MILKALQEKLAPLTVRELTEKDGEELFALHNSNARYSSLFQSEPVNLERVLKGLNELPPGTDKSRKHYAGVYGKGLLACLDFVEKYPDTETVFIGLLMVDAASKRQGLGTKIINAFLKSAGESGFKKARLACLENNTEGISFWLSQGFGEVERKVSKGAWAEEVKLIVMERTIKSR